MWDVIVLGSGIGGLGAAAALARLGRRVLLLEQHSVAGGLTQSFRRHEWTFAPGVHYIGGVGADPGPCGQFGRQLAWLTGDALQFAPLANPYDIIRLPGFEFGISHPEHAYREALHARFPTQHDAIEKWFDICKMAQQAALAMLAERGMPSWLVWGLHLWHGSDIGHWAHLTLANTLAEVPDPHLRAVLGARWGDYGALPDVAPLLEHALVETHYNAGAFYPVGGPARFSQTLVPVVTAAGGELRTGAEVQQILVTNGRVNGVTYEKDGVSHTEQTQHVISAMGVINTVACLDDSIAPSWQESVHSLQPGLSYISLFLGMEGDIAAAGASKANTWIFESEDISRIWRNPADGDSPLLFVSFPSLKDPAYTGKPTAEMIAPCDAQAFAPWMQLPDDQRPKQYLALKALIEQRLLAQFKRHFPDLASLVRSHELSTPVTQYRYVRSPNGAAYGVEMSEGRVMLPALRVRTPVQGLLLAGQDVTSPGIQPSFISGMMAAAAIEPALLRHLEC